MSAYADWLRARQSIPDSADSRNWFIIILSTNNRIVFLVQFGINKLLKFSKTTNSTQPTGSNSRIVFEKITCAYLFQIVLEIIWFTYRDHTISRI